MNRCKCSTHDEVHVGLRHRVCKWSHDRLKPDIVRLRGQDVCGTRGSPWGGKALTGCLRVSQSEFKHG